MLVLPFLPRSSRGRHPGELRSHSAKSPARVLGLICLVIVFPFFSFPCSPLLLFHSHPPFLPSLSVASCFPNVLASFFFFLCYSLSLAFSLPGHYLFLKDTLNAKFFKLPHCLFLWLPFILVQSPCESRARKHSRVST